MIWTKKFRKRKVQSVMIFLMVFICALLMTGAIVILSSLDKPYHDLAKETGAPELKVYPIENDAQKDWVSELSSLDSVEKVISVQRHFITEKFYTGNKKIETFASATIYNEEINSKERVLSGEMTGLKAGECYIPSVLANMADISVGDTITISYGKKEFNYKVKAVFADAYSLNTAFEIEILVKELPKELGEDSYYAVYTQNGKVGADVIEEYLNSHDGLLDGNFYTREECISNAHITENILGAILLVLSIVIFLVTSVMIRYMIRNALIHDKKSIAIYKAIGYTEKEVRGIYLTYDQFLVFAGAVLGVLASPMITQAFMGAAFENLGKADTVAGIGPGIAVAVVINLFVFLQILRELHRIQKVKPQELLSGNDSNLGVKQEKERKKTGKTGFSPFAMALRMIKRDKKNTAFIILTCFLSVYMVNMAIVCFDNMGDMKENNYYWLSFDKHDVTIKNTGEIQKFYDILEEVKKEPEVEAVVKRNLDVGISIPYAESVVAMVYEDYSKLEFATIEGRDPRNSNEVVVGNYYMKKLHKEIGDYMDIYLDGDTKVSLMIVGTCQGFYGMGKIIRLESALLEEHQIPIVYNEASVILQKGCDRQAFISKINKLYGGNAKAQPREEVYASIISKITDPQKAALGPFVIFTILIGVLNLIYIIYLKNLNNRKVYSIYKSMGYPVSHLIKMNCYYVGVIALVSFVIAIPLFMFLFPKVMVLAMSMFGFAEYKVTYHFSTMFWGNAAVLLVFLLGVLISSRELYKNHLDTLVSE